MPKNKWLSSGLFRGIEIKLVDFKVEFGKTKSNETIILADEISPDTCRLWDQKTDKKLDKDRFRKDLGNIVEAYQEAVSYTHLTLPTTEAV